MGGSRSASAAVGSYLKNDLNVHNVRFGCTHFIRLVEDETPNTAPLVSASLSPA